MAPPVIQGQRHAAVGFCTTTNTTTSAVAQSTSPRKQMLMMSVVENGSMQGLPIMSAVGAGELMTVLC